MKSHFEQLEKKLDEIKELMRLLKQQLTSQEKDVRQPRLAMEADETANTKTRERTEGAATAVHAMHGGNCTAQKVQDGPKTSISFGMKAEPLDLSCRDDVVVESGDAAQVVSPILGDAHNNSRWWLSSHRQNLHSNGDQFQPATSSVLLDQGDGFGGELYERSDFIRLLRQQLLETACCPLLPEGH